MIRTIVKEELSLTCDALKNSATVTVKKDVARAVKTFDDVAEIDNEGGL